jgi:hypothetical protein
MFKMSLKYMYKGHKATPDANNQEGGTPNGTQTAAIQKIGRKQPMSSKLMITTTTCLKEYYLTKCTVQ